VSALDGRPPSALTRLEKEGAAIQEASLLCVVGPEAGSPEVGGRALAAVAREGMKPLALCSTGRSTIIGVGREGAKRLLETLHSLFFA
jgi:hypothetical protein